MVRIGRESSISNTTKIDHTLFIPNYNCHQQLGKYTANEKYFFKYCLILFGKNLDNGQKIELPTNTSEYMHTMNSFGRSGHNIRLFTFRIMALQAKLYASLGNPKPPKF